MFHHLLFHYWTVNNSHHCEDIATILENRRVGWSWIIYDGSFCLIQAIAGQVNLFTVNSFIWIITSLSLTHALINSIYSNLFCLNSLVCILGDLYETLLYRNFKTFVMNIRIEVQEGIILCGNSCLKCVRTSWIV